MLSRPVRMQSVDDYLQKPQEIVDREVRLPKDGLESSPSKFIMHWNCQLPTIESLACNFEVSDVANLPLHLACRAC